MSTQILACGQLRLFGKTTYTLSVSEDPSLSVITKITHQPAAAAVASHNVKVTYQIVDFRAGGTLLYGSGHAGSREHSCTLESLQPERACVTDQIPFPDFTPFIEEGKLKTAPKGE